MAKGLKMIYDPETGERLGLTGFDEVQIDTLGFTSIGEKVTRLLTGEMNFRADEKQLEFDEEEGTFNDPEPDLDPTNALLDKTDIHDIHRDILEKQRDLASKKPVVTKVEDSVTVPTSGTEIVLEQKEDKKS